VKSSNLEKFSPPPFGVKHNIKKGTKHEKSCSKRKYTIAFESRLSVASLLAARTENPKRTIERVANSTAPAVKELSTFHLYFCSHISFHKQFVLHQFDEPQRKLLYHVTSVWSGTFPVWLRLLVRTSFSQVRSTCFPKPPEPSPPWALILGPHANPPGPFKVSLWREVSLRETFPEGVPYRAPLKRNIPDLAPLARSNFQPRKWLKPIDRYLRLNRFDQRSASLVISDRGIFEFRLSPGTFFWCCPFGLSRISCSGACVTTTRMIQRMMINHIQSRGISGEFALLLNCWLCARTIKAVFQQQCKKLVEFSLF